VKLTLLLVALVAIPVTAIAQQEAPPAAPANPTTPDEFVAARQQNMRRGGGALAMMKQTADSGGDLAALAPRIEALTAWTQRLPTLFPEGSGTSSSGARPEIWSDHAGFEAAATRFQTAVQALAAPAAAGDRAAFLAAWTVAHDACSACHDTYKI
jgi:cytochrome c556